MSQPTIAFLRQFVYRLTHGLAFELPEEPLDSEWAWMDRTFSHTNPLMW